MIEKIFNILWNLLNPQKTLDEHYDKIRKDKLSKPIRDQLTAEVTRAKINYGHWTFLILTILAVAVAIVAFHFGNP